MVRTLAAGMIAGYQRHVSPHKGYCCAYRVLHGRPSCSQFAKRLVLRSGTTRMLTLLPYRFVRCANARRTLAAQSTLNYESRRPDGKQPVLPKGALSQMACHGCDSNDWLTLEAGCCLFELLCSAL